MQRWPQSLCFSDWRPRHPPSCAETPSQIYPGGTVPDLSESTGRHSPRVSGIFQNSPGKTFQSALQGSSHIGPGEWFHYHSASYALFPVPRAQATRASFLPLTSREKLSKTSQEELTLSKIIRGELPEISGRELSKTSREETSRGELSESYRDGGFP